MLHDTTISIRYLERTDTTVPPRQSAFSHHGARGQILEQKVNTCEKIHHEPNAFSDIFWILHSVLNDRGDAPNYWACRNSLGHQLCPNMHFISLKFWNMLPSGPGLDIGFSVGQQVLDRESGSMLTLKLRESL